MRSSTWERRNALLYSDTIARLEESSVYNLLESVIRRGRGVEFKINKGVAIGIGKVSIYKAVYIAV